MQVELSIPDLHEALASSDKLGKILLNEKVELLRNMVGDTEQMERSLLICGHVKKLFYLN